MANPNFNPEHVAVFPSDGSGCGLYRLAWPGQAVKNTGKPITIAQRSAQIYVDQYQRIHGINVGSAGVVVFQRPGSFQIAEVIPILQSEGRKVVIDMDDSLSTIHPRNPAHKEYDPRISRRKNWMHAARACELADMVTVTTEALAEEYGKHGRVTIIPNHVPESYLQIPRPQNDVPVVGWAGWTKTHVDDLRVTRGMINQALVDTGAKFAAYGDNDIFLELGVRHRVPHEQWSFTNILDYPKTLAGFDIGLVPLQKSPFNEAKSWLKGLEYAAVGVIPVVTPIGDYQNLIDLGAALPAATPKDWYEVVKELVLDHEMRRELSEKVRSVASDFTIEANCWKWWSAWSQSGVVGMNDELKVS